MTAVTTTTQPGDFELTNCAAYASTAVTNEVQPHQPTQSSEYEYVLY